MVQAILDLDEAELDCVTGGFPANGGMALWQGSLSGGEPQGVGDLSFSAVASMKDG